MKPDPEEKEVTIYLPTANGSHEEFILTLPSAPNLKHMSLHQAVFAQLPYWGMVRTLRAFRRVVESGVEATDSISRFYDANVKLEIAKTRWQKRDQLRKAEIYAIQTELLVEETRQLNAESDRDEATLRRMLVAEKLAKAQRSIDAQNTEGEYAAIELQKKLAQTKLDLEKLQRELASEKRAVSHHKKVEKERRKRELLQAVRECEQEEKVLDNARNRESIQGRIKDLKKKLSEYAELETAKAEHLEQYGSVDKMPEWLQLWYEQEEDHLAHTGDR